MNRVLLKSSAFVRSAQRVLKKNPNNVSLPTMSRKPEHPDALDGSAPPQVI
jgi:hypothetical protein